MDRENQTEALRRRLNNEIKAQLSPNILDTLIYSHTPTPPIRAQLITALTATLFQGMN